MKENQECVDMLLRPELKKLIAHVQKHPPNWDLFDGIISIIRKNNKVPLIMISELHPNIDKDLYPHIPIQVARVIENEKFEMFIEPCDDVVVPIAATGLIYDSNLDEESHIFLQYFEVFLSFLFIKLIKNTNIPYGIFLGGAGLAFNLEVNDMYYDTMCDLMGTEIYYFDDEKVLMIFNGERINTRLSYTTELPVDNVIKDTLQFFSFTEDIKASLKKENDYFRILHSPLGKKIPPKRVSVPLDKSFKKVGMSELRTSFVMKDDLIKGEDITSDDEKRLVWSSIKNKGKFEAPFLQKGDILVPIKRKGSLNVAIICDELDKDDTDDISLTTVDGEDVSEFPIFIPKGDIAIIRLNPKKFSFKEKEKIAKLLMAELKNSPGDKLLSISILRDILFELFYFDDFQKVLEKEDIELIKTGRELLRKKIKKHLSCQVSMFIEEAHTKLPGDSCDRDNICKMNDNLKIHISVKGRKIAQN